MCAAARRYTKAGSACPPTCRSNSSHAPRRRRKSPYSTIPIRQSLLTFGGSANGIRVCTFSSRRAHTRGRGALPPSGCVLSALGSAEKRAPTQLTTTCPSRKGLYDPERGGTPA
eukprot:Lithocolla_globosa_v1_NODE_904_length_3103_cov_4.257874.p5 type:complete len:114 gc:universal NODE_904_length_3103_cov_4.257874:1670-2011(+)